MLATAVVLVASGLAAAQQWPRSASTNPGVSWMNFVEDDWTFAPAGVGTEVKGFLAWMDPGLVVGSNLTILWYQREVGDHWTTWAWESVSLGEASAWVALTLNDVSVFMEDPVLRDLRFVYVDEPPAGPVPMAGGLFLGDPAQVLFDGCENPEEIMSILVLNGWAAAPMLSSVAVNLAPPCSGQGQEGVEAMLNKFTSTFETTLFGETGVTLNCQWPCDGCTRVYGGWTPGTGPWTLDNRIPSAPGTDTCEWSRTGTRTWTETGKTWILCRACNDSDTDPGPETARTTVLRSDPCVPPA